MKNEDNFIPSFIFSPGAVFVGEDLEQEEKPSILMRSN